MSYKVISPDKQFWYGTFSTKEIADKHMRQMFPREQYLIEEQNSTEIKPKYLDWSKINLPSLKQLVWKLDREIWAKVEIHEATQSWGREQSALLILEFLQQFEQINLEEYSKFLEDKNYLDSDWREENPNSIQRFLFGKKLFESQNNK